MSEVVEFTGVSRLPSDPQRIIKRAAGAGLSSVVIVGFLEDGNEFFASSEADGGAALWLLERAKLKLLMVPDRE